MATVELRGAARPADDSAAVDAFIQHWAKSRIDEPREIMARHDEAAKQLIAVSTFLQAAYLAVFTFGDLKGHVPLWLLFVMFAPLLSVVVCAATVICAVPTDMNVYRALGLLRRSDALDGRSQLLDAEIKRWCDDIDRIATRKARWLHRGNLSFIGASLVTIGVLIAAGMV
jgi:hypothetical protein